MQILPHELKVLFMEAALQAFPELEQEELLKLTTLEDPKNESHGDYACPLPFKLAKKLGLAPQKIAEKILEHFPKDFRVEEVSFAAPGYLNLRLKIRYLEELLKELETGFHIKKNEDLRHRPVIVEYSSTNAAKPMGVHHIITTILGDALSNLFEFMGWEVVRINHLGDWGTQFGKLIYAVETWGDKVDIERHPNQEFMRLYVKFNDEAEKNPELDEEARKIFKQLEEGDELRLAMWQWMVSESIKDLSEQFQRLGIHFHHILGESFYRKGAEEVIQDGIQKGLFVEGEKGSLIYKIEGSETPALIRKGDGTTLYLTRDVATVKYRVDTWHPELILYVVDHAQSLHFQQDFAVAKALGYTEDTELEHVSFGRMNFKDRSMSSRKGNVIILDDLLDEAVKRAALLAAEKGTELPRGELKELAELVGVSSVKYAVLSQDRNKDIIFDWDKIITLEGNSAPYLLYSYARAHSIFNKVGRVELKALPKLTEESEIALMRKMVKFPDVLENALHERKPHIIATYLYELCAEFNRFYGSTSVLNAKDDASKRARLGLVQAFMHELKTGLTLLGIPVLEKM